MDEFRQQIELIDRQLIKLLTERMALSRKIGLEKSRLELPVKNKQRENEILNNLISQTDGRLSPEFLTHLYGVIFDESRKLQEE